MAGAHIGYLPVFDEDDGCGGLVAPARLAAVHDRSAHPDRLRPRDVTCRRRAFPRLPQARGGRAGLLAFPRKVPCVASLPAFHAT
jgi:hypothetical protein